jgi:AbrB family looped-hinge helix DNA binding protein
MKTTLTVSSRGVVTLPAKLRAALGINTDDQVIAEATPEGILLRPAVTLPLEMYTTARIDEFDAGEAELAAAFKAAPPSKATPNAKRKPARAR